jgi:RNA polymerase sigma-70 factor (ECF subfamily)
VLRNNIVKDVETQWLERARQGDPDAFGQLVEAYQVAVYNLCYRMLGEEYEAEDAAQETFLRAYDAMDRYDMGRPFSTWLLSIAAHYCIDQIRKKRMTFVNFQTLPDQEVPDPSPNPEASLSASEEQQRVRALLEILNPADRAAVVMYYWNDFSYEQIAEALDLTISAVKSRLHRARGEMARAWDGQHNRIIVLEGKRNESSAF